MTAPTPGPADDTAGQHRDLQIINLLSRLNTALAPDGELFKRLDHADELAHLAAHAAEARTQQVLESLQDSAAGLARVTGLLDEYGPLLERLKAMTSPGSVASAWVRGSKRGPRHRGDPQ